MKTNILKSNTLESFLESSASRYPNNTAIIEIKDYDKIYGILESKNDPNENNFNYLGKLSFSINRYLITKNIISENSKIKFIKTERHTAAFLCDNLYNLLQLFSSKLSLIQIFSIINKSNLDKVYFMQSEIEDLLEISMEFSGKIKTYRVQEKIDFLRLIKKLYQCYFIKINNYSNGVNNNCDLPIASRINLNELNIVQKDLTVTDMDLNQRDVLLMGDTLGMPTVGLLYIASYLWRNNVKSYCYFYDSSKDFETLCNNTSSLIKKIKPKIVGLSMKWFPYIEKVFETARIIKGINPDIIIVLGGNTASYYYNKVIDNDFVDYVIRGDGELPFLELCKGKNVEEIPNLVYIKKGGIYSNQIRFVHNDKNADDIYLSNLKDFLISKHASLFGMHFIPTQKGCNLNCTYCGGASEAQEKCFGRIEIFKRSVEEVRKDIIEAKDFTTTFMFDLIESNDYYYQYFKEITKDIDLSNHYIVYGNYIAPDKKVIDLLCKTFKYVYWELDMASLSGRHRQNLSSKNIVKLQITDKEIIDFYEACESYDNCEVRVNLISGLPLFKEEDIEDSNRMLEEMSRYKCFYDYHWGRLHAQPGAPITYDAPKYNMYSLAVEYEDFLRYSKAAFKRDTSYQCVETFNYPYVYYKDEKLNSLISKHSTDTRELIDLIKKEKRKKIFYESITYSNLNKKALKLARYLKVNNIKPGDRIGIIMDNTIDFAIALFGILYSKCIYVPINNQYPVQKQKSIINSADIQTLIVDDTCDRKSLEDCRISIYKVNVINNFEKTDDIVKYQNTEGPECSNIIFTSGTTGEPKGVMVTHKGMVNYFSWRVKTYNYSSNDITLQLLSNSFDAFGSNFFSSIISGGNLILIPESKRKDYNFINHLISELRVTNMSLVPPVLDILIKNKLDLSSMQFIALGGDKPSSEIIKKIKKIKPSLRLFNEYGPTEATIAVTANLNLESENTANIGSPISNTQISILDEDLQEVSVGERGEMYISGMGLSMGYVNDEKLTQQKFIKNPLNDKFMYRTGDIVKKLQNNQFEFVGRLDSQVKVRGYRIELSEIENMILKFPDIENAVINLSKENSIITGYFTANINIDIELLKGFLKDILPEYMLPNYLIQCDEFPINTNGKIDKDLLPNPQNYKKNVVNMPISEMQIEIAKIFAQTLGIDSGKIDIEDNFFDLGGNSINATIIISKLKKDFNVVCPPVKFYEIATIKKMERYIITEKNTVLEKKL